MEPEELGSISNVHQVRIGRQQDTVRGIVQLRRDREGHILLSRQGNGSMNKMVLFRSLTGSVAKGGELVLDGDGTDGAIGLSRNEIRGYM